MSTYNGRDGAHPSSKVICRTRPMFCIIRGFDMKIIFFTLLAVLTGCMAHSQDKDSNEPQKTEKKKMSEKIVKTDEEWKKILTPEQYQVTRHGGTECAFTGKFWDSKGKGTFKCVCCGNELFSSDSKFNSGTGWPSFWNPVSENSVIEKSDDSLGMKRTEILCARCDAHLGHVFSDGPKPTGLRFCINSTSLVFVEKKDDPKSGKKLETATFAAGCFWGIEAAFKKVRGVKETKVGYTGGKTENPTYKDVCTDKTSHAEAVQIQFDPSEIKYEELLEVFWAIHDPTTLNSQGPDFGTQYRSAIFCHSKEQKEAAEKSKKALGESKKYKKAAVTEITDAGKFYPAEDYHQDYFGKNGTHSCSAVGKIPAKFLR